MFVYLSVFCDGPITMLLARRYIPQAYWEMLPNLWLFLFSVTATTTLAVQAYYDKDGEGAFKWFYLKIVKSDDNKF